MCEVPSADCRSDKDCGPNTTNLQTSASGDTVFLRRPQLQWLKRGLATTCCASQPDRLPARCCGTALFEKTLEAQS